MPISPSVALEHLDPTSDRAVFRQIADQLREAIDKGRFREGDKLPSETELVEHFGGVPDDRPQLLVHPPGGGPGALRARQGRLRPAPPPGPPARLRPVRPTRIASKGRRPSRWRQRPRESRPEVDSLEVKEERPSQDISRPAGLAAQGARPSAPVSAGREAGGVRHLLSPAGPGPQHPDRPTQPRPRRHLRPAGGDGPPPGPLR